VTPETVIVTFAVAVSTEAGSVTPVTASSAFPEMRDDTEGAPADLAPVEDTVVGTAIWEVSPVLKAALTSETVVARSVAIAASPPLTTVATAALAAVANAGSVLPFCAYTIAISSPRVRAPVDRRRLLLN